MSEQEKSFKTYKKECRRAAKQLIYPKEVLAKIENATTEFELYKIMFEARRANYD